MSGKKGWNEASYGYDSALHGEVLCGGSFVPERDEDYFFKSDKHFSKYVSKAILKHIGSKSKYLVDRSYKGWKMMSYQCNESDIYIVYCHFNIRLVARYIYSDFQNSRYAPAYSDYEQGSIYIGSHIAIYVRYPDAAMYFMKNGWTHIDRYGLVYCKQVTAAARLFGGGHAGDGNHLYRRCVWPSSVAVLDRTAPTQQMEGEYSMSNNHFSLDGGVIEISGIDGVSVIILTLDKPFSVELYYIFMNEWLIERKMRDKFQDIHLIGIGHHRFFEACIYFLDLLILFSKEKCDE